MRESEFIGDFSTKQHEINYINELNGTISCETWCQLVEEHFTQSLYITETLDQDLVSQIQVCEDSFSSKPVVGNHYIPVPMFVIGNRLQIYDTEGSFPAKSPAQFNTLVKINDKSLEFTTPRGKELTWPHTRLSKLGYMTVILVNTVQTYDKLKTWVALKFDQLLPVYEGPLNA